MPLALLFLGLIVVLVGLGVLGSSILPHFRSRWKRRVYQGLGGVLGGVVLFVVGALLLPSPPVPSAVPTPSPTTALRAADSLPSTTTPQPPAAEPAPAVVARTPQPGWVLLTYVEGAHDSSAYRSSEELQDGLRSFTWDTVPGVAGGLVLYAVPTRRSQVYMAQLSDVKAPDEAFLGTAPRQVGETKLNRAFCVTDGPLAGTLVDVTHLTDGSKQVQVYSEAYRQLRNLRRETRCPA